jgi:hypothetical protein
MKINKIIGIAVSAALSLVMVLGVLFSGPVIKIENIEEEEIYTYNPKGSAGFNDEEILVFLKEKFPILERRKSEGNCLGDYNYTVTLADMDGDGTEETVLTGLYGVPVVILKSIEQDFKVLYQNDRVWNSSFKRDGHNNLSFNFSTGSGPGKGYVEEVVLRWDGNQVREVWKGTINDFNLYAVSCGGQWYCNTGVYEISGENKEKLRYVMREVGGISGVYGKPAHKEDAVVKEYIFDEELFKFIEK